MQKLNFLASLCSRAGCFETYLVRKLKDRRVATVREKVLENEKFSRSEKSQGITFSVREI